jgi:hypothetical protein
LRPSTRIEKEVENKCIKPTSKSIDTNVKEKSKNFTFYITHLLLAPSVELKLVPRSKNLKDTDEESARSYQPSL